MWPSTVKPYADLDVGQQIRRVRKATAMISRTIPQAASPGNTGFTLQERRAWQGLRLRYREEDHDRWTDRELAYLRFLRWHAQTGRLVEDGCPTEDGASPLSA
jgi:hypothetical protein